LKCTPKLNTPGHNTVDVPEMRTTHTPKVTLTEFKSLKWGHAHNLDTLEVPKVSGIEGFPYTSDP